MHKNIKNMEKKKAWGGKRNGSGRNRKADTTILSIKLINDLLEAFPKEVKDKELSKKIHSSDSLMSLAKEEILDMLMDSCKDVFGDDEEFLEEVKNNTSDYFKFYAKVRKGETWNKELGDAMVKKLTDEIHAASAYKEV